MAKNIKEIMMSNKSFVKEHKHLVKILRSGSKKSQLKEAKDQAQELARKN